MESQLNLTIAIPTIVSRAQQFEKLRQDLLKQMSDAGLDEKVEVIHLCDNKEMSIGAKRQKLYEMARGKFCVQIDDDDWVHPNYVSFVNDCIEQNPEVCAIGYLEHCILNGQVYIASHSDRWEAWGENQQGDGVIYPFVRTLFYKDPIRTDICLKVGVADLRYAEDRDFSVRLKESGLITSSIDLPIRMYYYRYRAEPFEEKYGVPPPIS